MLASTPRPPYYAVIFTSQRTEDDDSGYEDMAAHMVELAAQQPGYLGADSARGASGPGHYRILLGQPRGHHGLEKECRASCGPGAGALGLVCAVQRSDHEG